MLRIKYTLERETKNTYCFAPVGTPDPSAPVIFGKLWIGHNAFTSKPKQIEVVVESEALVTV